MNNMSFDEFKDAVVANIKDYLPDKYEEADIEIKQVLKNNDTMLDGITIRTPDSNMSPTIYLNNFYEEYENGKNFDSIVGDIADIHIANAVDQDFNISMVTDLENAKDNIVPRLVNLEDNKELLSDRPYQVMDDLAVTYCIQFGESEDGNMSVGITNALMEIYGLTQEELHEIAVANLEEKMPPVLRSMNDVIKEMMMPDVLSMTGGNREEAEQMISEMIPPDEGKMFVLTNENKVNGAAVILNEKAMDMVKEQIGDDFFVLPSSVHELLFVKKDECMELSDFENMVQEVNATQVSKEEKLSDHVYEYDSQNKELVRADRAEDREQKQDRSEKSHERVSVKEKIPEMKEKAAEKVNSVIEKAAEKKKEVALG